MVAIPIGLSIRLSYVPLRFVLYCCGSGWENALGKKLVLPSQNPADIVAAILAIRERLLQAEAVERRARTVYRWLPTSENMQRVTDSRRAVDQLTEEYLEICEPAVQSTAARAPNLRPLLDTPI